VLPDEVDSTPGGFGGLVVVVVVVVATQTVFRFMLWEMIEFERGEVVLLFFP